MTELLDLPPELIEIVLSKCETPSLIKLRLVSKMFKTNVDISTRFQDALDQVQINLHNSTLQKFVESAPNLPFTNFYISLSKGEMLDPSGTSQLDYSIRQHCAMLAESAEFYVNAPHIQKFKKTFCPHIKKLHVSTMFCCTLDAELDFYRSLGSLSELVINYVQPKLNRGRTELLGNGVEVQIKRSRLPFTKPNRMLKRLAIDKQWLSNDYVLDWMCLCPSLEVIKIPGGLYRGDKMGIGDFEPTDLEKDECFPYILRLGVHGHLEHLQTLDLNGIAMRMDLCSQQDIQFFTEMVSTRKIRLENVSSAFVHRVRDAVPLETFSHFRDRVVSFSGRSRVLKEDEFNNVKTLSFNFGRAIQIPDDVDWTSDAGTMRLQSLQKITGVIWPVWSEAQEARGFLDCLFSSDELRPTVTQLDIEYQTQITCCWQQSFGLQPEPLRVHPRDFDVNLPNLTRMIMKLDGFTNVELCQLIGIISRKSNLEELSLATPRGIPESAFFGENSEEIPVFHRLNKLKKLTLDSSHNFSFYGEEINFERMGNRMLSLLSKMSLTHLTISGRGWDDGTPEEIVEGPFAQSILFAQLEALKGTCCTDAGEKSESFEKLERICHANRVACGLTSNTFEQFKASEELIVCKEYPFRNRGWSDRKPHLDL